MEKTVILIESINRLGGTEIVALNLVNALNDSGIDCRILPLEPYEGDIPNIIRHSESDLESLEHSSKGTFGRIIGKLTIKESRKKFIREYIEKYHVKNLICFSYDLIDLIVSQELSCRVHCVLHWSIQGYEESLKQFVRRKKFTKRIVSSVLVDRKLKKLRKDLLSISSLVCLTNSGKEELKSLGIKDSQIHVIPNFLPTKEKPSLISDLRNKRVIFVGRLSREKGTLRLLKVWARITQNNVEATLSIYGEGPDKDMMVTKISEEGIRNVEFMGFESDLNKIYGSADILLMTSESEGFGMVLIEAMDHGVVPVAFDCPVSPKEIIGNAGITIPMFDEDKFSDEVVKLLNDTEALKRLQIKGIVRAKDFYPNTIVNLWNNLLTGNTTSV